MLMLSFAARTSAAALMLVPLLLGCGVPEEEHRAVVRQRDSLATALDDLRFGAPRLLAAAQAAFEAGQFEAGQFEAAHDTAQQLVRRHGATPEGKTGAQLLADATTRIAARDSVAAEERRVAAARVERARRDSAAALERRVAQAVAGLTRHRDDVRGVTYVTVQSSDRRV